MKKIYLEKETPSKLSSQQYTYVAVKEIINNQPSYNIDFYTPIEQYLQYKFYHNPNYVQTTKQRCPKNRLITKILIKTKRNDILNHVKNKIIR